MENFSSLNNTQPEQPGSQKPIQPQNPAQKQPIQQTQQTPASPSVSQTPVPPTTIIQPQPEITPPGEPKRHPIAYLILTILLIGGNIASYLFIEGNLMSSYFLYSSIFLGIVFLSWIVGLYRPLRFIFAVFLFLLIAFSVINPLWTVIMPKEDDQTAKAPETINSFFDAKSKHGTFNYYIDRDGKIVEQDMGEYWIKGNKFVLQYPETPNSKIKVISNNGSDVYFCYDSKKICEPSPMSIDYYLMHYTKSYASAEDIGLDKKENCRKYRYSLKKIEEKTGAHNPWYVEDIIYCATNDSLYYFEDTGNSAKNGIPTELRLFHGTMKTLELNIDLSDSIFELPYGITATN